MNIDKIAVKFNESSFDFECTGGQLSKDGCISLEQDIYLDDERVFKAKLNKRQLILESIEITMA